MKRRSFLKLSLASAAGALVAKAQAEAATSGERAAKGFKVGARQDRSGEELLIMGGRFDCKVSGKDTGGGLCIYDTIREAKGGPALHLHHAQDEWFYVIRGDFIVRVGEDTVRLRPGDSAFGPRQIPHTFAMISEGVGQMLVVFQPAGSMEDFFRQMSRLGKDILKNQEVVLKKLCEQHGMAVVGPPLRV